MHQSMPTCWCLSGGDPCQACWSLPSTCEPGTWWDLPLCLQLWLRSHPPKTSSKQSNWLIILLVTDLWKLYKCVPFCALPGSGCSLWLRSWWGWRCNPERWCSPTWIHQTCHTHFLHLAPLAQDASLSVGAETLDDSLNLYHLKGLVHPITNLRDKWI